MPLYGVVQGLFRRLSNIFFNIITRRCIRMNCEGLHNLRLATSRCLLGCDRSVMKKVSLPVEEEDVGSYWMTLRKGEDTLI